MILSRDGRTEGLIADDPNLPFLKAALDPRVVEPLLKRRLQTLRGRGDFHIHVARLVRHKVGRRCLIEYEIHTAEGETITLLGKARARGPDTGTYLLTKALRAAGLAGESSVSVPEPLGVVPELRMWLQRKAPGTPGTRLLPTSVGPVLARRIAGAAHRLHRAGVVVPRQHSLVDELEILHSRLEALARVEHRWRRRLEHVLVACDRLAAGIGPVPPQGIHRDFYADQVLVYGDRLYLLDFDLYAMGDPALDIGNFLGHMVEQSVRSLGSPRALGDAQQALETRFLELAGQHLQPRVRVYTTLTLVRHVALSAGLPDRRQFASTLLDLCEDRLSPSLS